MEITLRNAPAVMKTAGVACLASLGLGVAAVSEWASVQVTALGFGVLLFYVSFLHLACDSMLLHLSRDLQKIRQDPEAVKK